jgi:hypothetical protein
MSSFWDETYEQHTQAYGLLPNLFFRACLNQCQPGTLLLPGEGPGRNALYAAARGWTVTAFDTSEVARAQALKRSQELQLPLRYVPADFLEFPVEPNHYDVLALVFIHVPRHCRQRIHRHLGTGLKKGGKLILQAYHEEQLTYKTGGPRHLDLLYRLGDLLDDFETFAWDIARHVEQELEEGTLHQGRSSLIELFGEKQN